MNDWKLIDEKNQEIAELKSLVDFDTKAILKDSDTIDAQQLEIARLKSLAAYAEQRANIAEKANDALVLKNASLSSQVTRGVDDCNKLVIENNELKAMVEQLRGGLGFYADCGHYKISDGRDLMIMDYGEKAEEAISKTPKQCLASANQQAIKDAIFNSEKVEFEGSHYVGTFVSLEDLEVNIKQLGDES